MAVYLGSLPPYVLNRGRVRRTTDGKYKYYYPNSSKAKAVTMSEDFYLLLSELDRKEYNNDRKEIRHRGELTPYHDDYEYEKTNPWNNVPDQNTFFVQDDICERLDRETVLAKLSDLDRKIYCLCVELDCTQTVAAKILKLNQSTIARRLAVVYDLVETERFNDGTRTAEEIRFEILWLELLRTGKTKNDDDIFVELILTSLHPDDLWLFLNWFYSVKEFCRYILKYLILRENYAQADVDSFLETASDKGKKHFTENYGDKPLLIQCVYINLLTEAWRRVKSTDGLPSGAAYENIEVLKDKIVKRQKTTDDKFLCNRFFPMIFGKRRVRHKEFLRKYKKI